MYVRKGYLEMNQAWHVQQFTFSEEKRRKIRKYSNQREGTCPKWDLEEKKQSFGLHSWCLPMLRWGLIISQLKEI